MLAPVAPDVQKRFRLPPRSVDFFREGPLLGQSDLRFARCSLLLPSPAFFWNDYFMWCSDCQQDVPAVARAAAGPLVCPRCVSVLSDAVPTAPLADTGLALQSYDVSAELPNPFDQLEKEQTNQRLRSIGRRLRGGYRTEGALGQSLQLRHDRAHHAWEPAIEQQLRGVSNKANQESSLDTRPTNTSWLISLMLLAGIATFCGGVGLLAWSSAFQLPATWQWGMTATLAAEGTLIVTLVWMATKLWHSSRRTNRQLVGVDRHLTALRHQAESPAFLMTTSGQ